MRRIEVNTTTIPSRKAKRNLNSNQHEKGEPIHYAPSVLPLLTSQAIIIGGGPAGLCTALRLSQTTDISCTVYELRPVPTTIGGAVGIPCNGLRLFDRLGVYKTMGERGNNEPSLTLHGLSGGVVGKQNLVAGAGDTTGHGYMRIKRADLVDALLKAAKKAKIAVHFDKKITSITETDSYVTATFADGTTETADILIGTDGIHSAVRKLYVDPEQEPQYTGHAALGAVVAANTVQHDFVKDLEGLNAVLTHKGLFAAIPCSPSKSELLWFFSKGAPIPESGDSRDGWEVKRKEEVANYKDELRTIIADGKGDFVALLRAILDATKAVNFYPIFKLNEGVRWHKGRCILLGDAAHAMSPSAGQGTSMAIEDAFMLSRLLENPDTPLCDAFKAFDVLRRPRVEELGRIALRNASIRKPSSAWGLWVKEWALWGFLAMQSLFKGVSVPARLMAYDVDEVDVAAALKAASASTS